MASLQDKTSLLSLPIESLPGEGYRRQQLAGWLYARGARQWDQMTDLPRALRNEWAEQFRVSEFAEVLPYPSQDGSVKYLYTLLDGQKTEAVYMP
ncbi:MAG: 23S rRNA (adenine(2503)-C(2))-methyltransferase RlmN, partial [Meiothermus sp.]|nr:23S rRNA (adenine(2503)-C(2))-methyltransferase RlmN [Meiothermus sp.]